MSVYCVDATQIQYVHCAYGHHDKLYLLNAFLLCAVAFVILLANGERRVQSSSRSIPLGGMLLGVFTGNGGRFEGVAEGEDRGKSSGRGER